MSNFKKCLTSILLVIALLFSTVCYASAETDTELMRYFKSHGITDYYKETVDGSWYYYVVNDNEASIIHILTRFTGPDKITYVFPSFLGGYPVTSLGIPNDNIEIFAYYDDGEVFSEICPGYSDIYEYVDSEGALEYDPGLKNVSKIVIPEGYEYIGAGALRTFDVFEWQFPKSLKMIYGAPFESVHTSYIDYKNNSTILPDCVYDDPYYFSYMLNASSGYNSDKIVAPSRDAELTRYLLQEFWNGLLYIPNILSYETVRRTFYYSEDSGQTWYPKKESHVLNVACAPDCEWLKVFEDYPGTYYSGYTLNVTYIEPATHIAFDSDSVSVEVGEVVDLEAKTYPAEAVWTACDYVSSNPEVVKVDPYSGRITALAEGEATITATHVERGFVDTCTVKVENKPEHICTPAEKWSADETAHWLECTDPECGEIVNYAEHSGGNATVNAKAVCEHCGTAYGEYASASLSVEPVSDIAYCAREKREYKITVAENADKVQFIRDSGSTTTFVRSQAAEIINNGDGTETWILAVSLNKGKYTLATKYGKVWNKNGIEFEIVFDTPKCRSFTSEKVGNLTTFTVVTDPQVAKVQLITQSGNTLTYTQSNSYIGDDGLRYWTVVRKITKPGTIGLRTKYGYTWTTTDFTIEV